MPAPWHDTTKDTQPATDDFSYADTENTFPDKIVSESQEKASDKKITSCLMFIEGDQGSGTGVVIQEGTNKYLYTNLHVLSGNKKIKIKDIEGNIYAIKEIHAARDRDLVRLEFRIPPKQGLKLGKNIQKNTPITIQGNAEGADVMRTVKGEILGIGPETLEVNAKFVQGHSGSPVLTKDGAVVGIATYVTHPTTNFINKNTDFSEVRRFAVRIDTATWQPVNPRYLVKESLILIEKEKAIYSALEVLSIWAKSPVLGIISATDDTPDELKRWIYDHNAFVKKFKKRGTRYWSERLRNDYNLDFDRLISAVKGVCHIQEPHWHLPQYKKQWDTLEETENIVITIMQHIKESISTN